MRLDGHYDPRADIAWLRFEDYDPQSAVDEESEGRLYTLLRDRLPGVTLVSVGHRSTLRAFHRRTLVVTPSNGGPATVAEAPSPA